ncbi:MAG: DUF4419 domain-containing protein [Myxococcota bacterium]
MAITFDVADVPVGQTRLQRIPVAQALGKLATTGPANRVAQPVFEAVCEIEGGIHHLGVHPLVGAVHLAFDLHLPLELSPDHVWIVLAQGFARHIRLHADALRHHFVQHEGNKTLTVHRDDFVKGDPHNPWPEVFDGFSAQLREHLGKRHDLVVANFSTTGALERAVSQLVLMEAMERYFEYEVATLCGIPRVTLTGTPADWQSVRERARVLSEFGLAWWTDHLMPVLDGFVAAAEGKVDREFWCGMYKQIDESGGPYITGWIQRLFPYLLDDDKEPYRNSLVETTMVTSTEFPGGLSRTPFRWTYLGQPFDMSFIGGFIGVEQEPTSGTVTPQLGWAIQEH